MKNILPKILESKFTEPTLIVLVSIFSILQIALPLGQAYLPFDFVPEEECWNPVFICSNIVYILLYFPCLFFWMIYLYSHKQRIWLMATFYCSIPLFLCGMMQMLLSGTDYTPDIGVLISLCFAPTLLLLVARN